MKLKKKFMKRLVKWGIIIFIVIAIVVNAPSFFSLYYKIKYSRDIEKIPPAPDYNKNDTLLILSPHPDDETLCCSGIIQKAQKAGAKVYIVWLTSGDGFEWDSRLINKRSNPGPSEMIKLGKTRMEEAKNATKILGVPQENLFFLGYPDRSLLRLFLDHYIEPRTSPYTELNKISYENAFSPGSYYTGKNLERDLGKVINIVNPTIVLAPSPEDTHSDHKATAYLALRIFGEKGETNKLRFWIVHGGYEWPLPKGWHTDIYMVPPPKGKNINWEKIELSEDEVNIKKQAIKAHKTQTKIVGRFMAAFAKKNELISAESLPIIEESEEDITSLKEEFMSIEESK